MRTFELEFQRNGEDYFLAVDCQLAQFAQSSFCNDSTGFNTVSEPAHFELEVVKMIDLDSAADIYNPELEKAVKELIQMDRDMMLDLVEDYHS